MNLRNSLLAFVCLAVPAAGAAAERDVAVSVTRDECARVVAHTPAPDVAYRPGVDVRGRKVAPADLGGGYQFDLPDEITIELRVDLEERFGIPDPANLYEGKLPIGKVTVKKDGRVFFEGEEIAREDRLRLEAKCRELLEKDKGGK